MNKLPRKASPRQVDCLRILAARINFPLLMPSVLSRLPALGDCILVTAIHSTTLYKLCPILYVKFLIYILVQGVSEVGDQLKKSQTDGVVGNITKAAGEAFGQATSGVKEFADKAIDAIGADDKLDAVVHNVSSGQSAGGLIDKAKDLIGDNKVEASILVGGLGALLLVTKRGRKVTKEATAIGGSTLIGGLTYKAFQNFHVDKPLLSDEDDITISAPPRVALIVQH